MMKHLILAVTFALALSAPASWAKGDLKTKTPRPAPREFHAEVLRVTDGDTIVVRTPDLKETEVRLYGIDAPERGQPGGAEAAAALKPLQGQTVKVTAMGSDLDSRTLGLIEHEGLSINQDLAAQGYVWHYDDHCVRDEPACRRIQAAEAEARAAELKIWSGEPTPPWEWRRRE